MRENEDLSYEEWAERLTTYFGTLERLLSPDLFVIGGGVSKKAEKFIGRIGVVTPLVAAELRNTAGIVGAALLALRGARGLRVHRGLTHRVVRTASGPAPPRIRHTGRGRQPIRPPTRHSG